jgi:transposase-like protein
MAQRTHASTQSRWLKLIRRWQRSRPKATIREFCQRHALSEPSFYSWRRLLRQRGLLQEPPPTPTPTTPAFVNLTVAAEPAPATTAIELVLGDRRLLRVRAGFDPDTLVQLVRLLEEPPC